MLDLAKEFRFREKIHMRWSDLDEMRHVNNAVYLTYFEQGRLNYFRQGIGWDWQQLGMIQARAEIDYLLPLFLRDNPFLYIRIVKLGNKSLTVEELVVDEPAEGAAADQPPRLIAKGLITLVAYDYKSQSSVPIPEEERAKIIQYEKKVLV